VRPCVECGYTWRVPRSGARGRIGVINMFSVAPEGKYVDRVELRREIKSISRQNQPPETFRHFPKCGADHFTQRAWRPAGNA
jgi:hypothetical protein